MIRETAVVILVLLLLAVAANELPSVNDRLIVTSVLYFSMLCVIAKGFLDFP